MSEKVINIAPDGKVSPDPCQLSKSTEVLYCNNHAPVAYELCFAAPGPFGADTFLVDAGEMHHLIGSAETGEVGKSYSYDCVAKTEAGAAADPTIIITK